MAMKTRFHTVNGEIIGETPSGSPRVDYLTDALGSVTATVNQSAQIVNTYRYKPYGAQLAKTGIGPDPAFGWVGTKGYRPTQSKFSDFYVRRRHDDSTTGRWTSPDPREGRGMAQNKYVYVLGNTQTFRDPSGLKIEARGGCPYSGSGGLIASCCDRFQTVFGGPGGSSALANVIACMAINGYTNPTPIRQAVSTWIPEACNAAGGRTVCLWCLPKGKDDIYGPPYNYHCRGNPCTGSIGGETEVSVEPPAIGVIGTGNTNNTQIGQCTVGPSNCPEVANYGCNAVVVLCSTRQGNGECAALIHELIHAGGVGLTPGHHREKGGDKGDDFVYALGCCICWLMFPNDSKACGAYCGDVKRPPAGQRAE